MSDDYLPPDRAPSREEMDGSTGRVLLEFGTEWCGYCRALAPHVEKLLAAHTDVRHLKVEDGPGQPLGRSYRVKLWPNLVLLSDGVLTRQLARPTAQQLGEAFEAFVAQPAQR